MLEHYFGNPDVIGIGQAAPGQTARIVIEPSLQTAIDSSWIRSWQALRCGHWWFVSLSRKEPNGDDNKDKETAYKAAS